MEKIKALILQIMIGLACFSFLGCGAALKYNSSRAVELFGSSRDKPPVVIPELMDGRHRGKESKLPLRYGSEREDDFSQLREAVRDHTVNSNFVEEHAPIVPAPGNPQEVEQILKDAAGKGAKAVLFLKIEGLFTYEDPGLATAIVGFLSIPPFFVGIIPLTIVYSLPINSEYASTEIHAYLVDPAGKRLIGDFRESIVFNQRSVSAWAIQGNNLPRKVLFEAMEKILKQSAEAISSGDRCPGRNGDVARFLFSAPWDTFETTSSAVNKELKADVGPSLKSGATAFAPAITTVSSGPARNNQTNSSATPSSILPEIKNKETINGQIISETTDASGQSFEPEEHGSGLLERRGAVFPSFYLNGTELDNDGAENLLKKCPAAFRHWGKYRAVSVIKNPFLFSPLFPIGLALQGFRNKRLDTMIETYNRECVK
jgi:hypothetical protein